MSGIAEKFEMLADWRTEGQEEVFHTHVSSAFEAGGSNWGSEKYSSD